MSSEFKSFDRVAHVYDETRGLPPEVEREVGANLAALVRTIAPAARVLEVGAGTGRVAVPLAAAGVRVAAADISPKMLSLLRTKSDVVDVLLAEATHLPFRARSFDVVLFVHILHLVPDAAAAVRAALALLRPGGAIIQGGDDRAPGLRVQADYIIQRIVGEILGREIGTWDAHGEAQETCERVLAERGAALERVTLARWTGTQRADRMLERLARKDYSNSWKIPDEILGEVVARARPELEALYGGLEREAPYERSFSVTVGRL